MHNMSGLSEAITGQKVLASSRLVAIEGVDAAGKTTLINTLVPLVQGLMDEYSSFYDCSAFQVRSFSPWGANDASRAIRQIMVENGVRDQKTEAMLAFAARRMLILEDLVPHTARGGIAILDRYVASTFAYQVQTTHDALFWADLMRHTCESMMPGLTLFLTVDPDEAAHRRGTRNALDAIESRGAEFFEELELKYATAFAVLTKASSGYIVQIDANQDPEKVAEDAMEALRHHFTLLHSIDMEKRKLSQLWMNQHNFDADAFVTLQALEA